MRKFMFLIAASIAVPAMGQAVPGHVHSFTCNHQWSDDQGALIIGALDLNVDSVISVAAESIITGMTFTLNDLGGVGVGTQARAGFIAAAAMWSNVLKDPVNIRLDVSFVALGAGILGSTGSSTNSVGYVGLSSLLAGDVKSASDASAVAALQPTRLTFATNEPLAVGGPIDATTRFLDNNNTTDNNFIQINTAQVKALGQVPVYDTATNAFGRDGAVQFSNAFTWDFDPSDGITAGAFDFVGVAAHEIGHALGFRSGVDLADGNAMPFIAAPGRTGLKDRAWGTVHDLQRFGTFNSGTVMDWTIGGTPCFSINGGATCEGPLSTGRRNGDLRQASHWKDDTLLNIVTPLGIMDPTASGPGGIRPMVISRLDLLAFDVMGYDLAVVPEPSSWLMMIAGFGLVGGALRRRRQDDVTVA